MTPACAPACVPALRRGKPAALGVDGARQAERLVGGQFARAQALQDGVERRHGVALAAQAWHATPRHFLRGPAQHDAEDGELRTAVAGVGPREQG